MKGFLFVIFIYVFSLAVCVFVKMLIGYKKAKKRSGDNTASKIYYVTTTKKPKSKGNKTVPIQATLVEKETTDKPPF